MNKLNLRTSLGPAPLGQGGYIQKMATGRNQLHQLKQQRIDLDHQIKSMELRAGTRTAAPKKASAPKNQGTAK